MKPLAPNTLIQGRYLVVHLIGKGGMGEVYLAVDQRLGSAVALKRTYFAGDEMLGNAFEREARTLARMRHPVLPKVSDHFGEGEEQYLVMEHIAGDDLAKRLEAAQKPFPVSWVMFWADQLLDALSYLHQHEPPIIHRDIKPQNLKLTDENHIILLDFGLSKTSTGQTHISNSGSTGSVVGYTPHYAPMEQIRGIGTSARSDLYSLSATLYQLITNVVPADALSRADAMLTGLGDPIEAPHRLNPEIPESVSGVILKGLEVSQEKRYQNARDMQKELRRAFSRIQEAMSAQTMAFNVADAFPAEQRTRLMPSEPLISTPAPSTPTPSLRSQPAPPVAPEPEPQIDLEATLAFDPIELFNSKPGRDAEVIDDAPPQAPPVEPIVTPADEDRPAQNSFVTVAASPASRGIAGADVFEAPRVPPPAPPAGAIKKSGRAGVIVGTLAVLLVLGLGGAAAGWYYFNNFSGVVAEPAPSPEASPIEQVVPSPTVETVLEASPALDANSNAPEPPVAEASPAEQDPGQPRTADPPAQRPVNRPATRPASSPATRATPKPKANPGRTDILQ